MRKLPALRRARVALTTLFVSTIHLVACSSDPTTSSTGSTSGQSPGPGGGSSSDGAPPNDGEKSDESGSKGGTEPSGDKGDDDLRCRSSGSACMCAQGLDSGDKTTTCSKASIGGSGRCCATNTYPTNGGCTCMSATPSCHQAPGSSICKCGLAPPDANEQVVGACTGQVCCVDPNNIAPTCACFKNLSSCVSGTQVPSCNVAALACDTDSKAVESCK